MGRLRKQLEEKKESSYPLHPPKPLKTLINRVSCIGLLRKLACVPKCDGSLLTLRTGIGFLTSY